MWIESEILLNVDTFITKKQTKKLLNGGEREGKGGRAAEKIQTKSIYSIFWGGNNIFENGFI